MQVLFLALAHFTPPPYFRFMYSYGFGSEVRHMFRENHRAAGCHPKLKGCRIFTLFFALFDPPQEDGGLVILWDEEGVWKIQKPGERGKGVTRFERSGVLPKRAGFLRKRLLCARVVFWP